MSEIKELLVEELQDLLHAENQLVAALPKMASAAKSPKLREAFEKHLEQTKTHVQRLNQSFDLLGTEAKAKTCRGMAGLIEEGQERISDGSNKDEVGADVALVAAAQKVEHYEIAAYGTARTLALATDEREVARLLERTLGEEESTDFLLTQISKPLLQQARSEDLVGAGAGRKTRTGSARHA
jgi:Mn-containing catalase